MTTYILSPTDSHVYSTNGYYQADIELETLLHLHETRRGGLVEVVTSDGRTAFFVLDGTLLDL